MVGASTKRRRRERGNKVAAAVEEARAQEHQEKLALGTAVTPSAPDKALFTVDRKKDVTMAPATPQPRTAAERAAAKRARRAAPTQRRSEASATVATTAGVERALPPPPRKNKALVPSTEAQILARRTFRTTEARRAATAARDGEGGHQMGDGRVLIRPAKFRAGREDLWSGAVADAVAGEVTQARREMLSIMNERHREAPAILVDDTGMSMNPTYDQHQDKLGEAVADIYAKEEEQRIVNKKMSFDPRLLQESREGEVGDTGMKDDAAMEKERGEDDEDDENEEEEEATVSRPVPERKTRAMRNKERRKTEMAMNIKRKASEARRAADFANFDEVKAAAIEQSDLLSGETKKRRLAAGPQEPRRIDLPVIKTVAGKKVRNEHAAARVALSTDLAGNMRSVRMPVANAVMRDRFLSLERRGMVEPPSVLPKEVWRMNKEKRAEEMKDRRKRKGRGANSNLTFWKQGKKSIR